VPLPLPDRYKSPYWYYGSYDEYGVHHNMGVGSKLAYLLTDGDTFNNYEVKGLGIDTASQLFWILQSSLLTEATDYPDLYPALLEAGRLLDLDLQNITRACMAVEIVPAYAMTPFKITYSGCDMKVVDGTSLFVENCTDRATVNIQKISRFPSNVQLTNNHDFIKPGLIYMASGTMPLVKVQGNLRRFQTQARIFSLDVAGTIDTLVAKETNIGSISAAAIRKLSISDKLPGPRTVTSIEANGNPVPDKFSNIQVNLKGVTLKKLDTPLQAATLKAATRKVSEGGVIVYVARADLANVNVGDSLTATAKGANIVGDMVARGVVKKVAATPITYTREGVVRVYGGYIGDPEGDLLYNNEERVLMSIWDHQVWIAGGEKNWPGQASALVGTVSAPLGILAYVVAGYDQYPEVPTLAGKVNALVTKPTPQGGQGLWGIMAKNPATKVRLAGDPTAFVSQRIRLYENLAKLPPVNDNVPNAIAVSGQEGLAYGANVWATVEAGEPDHAGLSPFRSVWWRWTAPRDMRVTFTTQGSRFHSVLSVYSGTAASNLLEVSHLDTSSDLYSAIHFSAEAGKSYLICVDGNPSLSDAEADSRNYRGAGQGMIQLQWKPAVGPTNDNFADAADLGASAGTLTATNYLATRQTGEPDHAGVHGSASVWYSIMLDNSSNLTIYTAGSTFDTLLAAYTGDTVGDLTPIAQNDNAGALTSEITFAAQAGTTYYIAVDGKPGNDMGSILLAWSARPINDDFADALPINGAQGATFGTNVNATLETGEFNAALGIAASVWWRFTAPATSGTEPVVFDTQGSEFDTVLLIYQGTNVGALNLVAFNDDATTFPLLSTWSRVSTQLTAGQDYMICVCGFNTLEVGRFRSTGSWGRWPVCCRPRSRAICRPISRPNAGRRPTSAPNTPNCKLGTGCKVCCSRKGRMRAVPRCDEVKVVQFNACAGGKRETAFLPRRGRSSDLVQRNGEYATDSKDCGYSVRCGVGGSHRLGLAGRGRLESGKILPPQAEAGRGGIAAHQARPKQSGPARQFAQRGRNLGRGTRKVAAEDSPAPFRRVRAPHGRARVGLFPRGSGRLCPANLPGARVRPDRAQVYQSQPGIDLRPEQPARICHLEAA
jgi:hypothetical protein